MIRYIRPQNTLLLVVDELPKNIEICITAAQLFQWGNIADFHQKWLENRENINNLVTFAHIISDFCSYYPILPERNNCAAVIQISIFFGSSCTTSKRVFWGHMYLIRLIHKIPQIFYWDCEPKILSTHHSLPVDVRTILKSNS